MSKKLDDDQVRARIEQLEQEEQRLRADEGEAGEASARGERVARDAQRLEDIRVELNQLWDYLRQRQALRASGQNPDGAQMRDADVVEHYLG